MRDDQWLDPAQQHAVAVALGAVHSWAAADEDHEAVLVQALRDQDPATVMIGLATVTRLLAIELGAGSGRSELTVLDDLTEQTVRSAPLTDGHRRRR